MSFIMETSLGDLLINLNVDKFSNESELVIWIC